MPEEVYLQISGSPQDICMTVYHSYSQQSFPFYTVCAQNKRAYDSMLERERARELESKRQRLISQKNNVQVTFHPKIKGGKNEDLFCINEIMPIFRTINTKIFVYFFLFFITVIKCFITA